MNHNSTHNRWIRLIPPTAWYILWSVGQKAGATNVESVSCFQSHPRQRSVARFATTLCETPAGHWHEYAIHGRSFTTNADQYFRQHGRIPEPRVKHAVLTPATEQAATDRSGILVIGDVHGCYDELLQLHRKAIAANDGRDFSYVILVGDLCNKGPYSVRVIRHVRMTPYWSSIRGNHDDSALAASLGDPRKQSKSNYSWIFNVNPASTDSLSDDDIQWMAELPYSLRIPKDIVGSDKDVVIVHAGLVPGVDLQDQSIDDMVTLREVVQTSHDAVDVYCQASQKGGKRIPWAQVWTSKAGQFSVIFGHDARRGLQQYPDALGLDTGACYGKSLTGVILHPDGKRTLVSVPSAKVYTPVSGSAVAQ